MAPQSGPMRESPIVAVVDDDPAVCNSLKFSLELEGFQVRTYVSGAALLRSGDLDDCDCFVIDQKMPGLSGSTQSRRCGAGNSRRRRSSLSVTRAPC